MLGQAGFWGAGNMPFEPCTSSSYCIVAMVQRNLRLKIHCWHVNILCLKHYDDAIIITRTAALALLNFGMSSHPSAKSWQMKMSTSCSVRWTLSRTAPWTWNSLSRWSWHKTRKKYTDRRNPQAKIKTIERGGKEKKEKRNRKNKYYITNYFFSMPFLLRPLCTPLLLLSDPTPCLSLHPLSLAHHTFAA